MIHKAPLVVTLLLDIHTSLHWYRFKGEELSMVLLGVSLGLKSQGIVIADLELAIGTGQPEIFLGKEVTLNEQEPSKAVNK